MQIAVIASGLSVLIFLCMYFGFRAGLRLGMAAAKGQAPAKPEPVKAVLRAFGRAKRETEEATAEKKRNDLFRGFGEMMKYTGEPKQGI